MTFAGKSVLFVRVLMFSSCFGYHDAEVYRIGAILDKPDPRDHPAIKQAFYKAVSEINEEDPDYIFEALTREITVNNPFESVSATCQLLQEEVVGILGPFSEDNSNVVQSICDLKEIPHIEVRWDDYPLNGTVVNVHPYPDTLTRTYYDLIVAWGWEDFVILYENNESLQRVGELIKLFEPSKQRIVVRQLNSQEESEEGFRTVLKEVRKSGATHFVLDCSYEILEEVLRQAQQVGLMTDKHNFIITNLDLHTINLTPFKYSETNITGMRCVNPDKFISDELDPLAGYQLKLEEALIYDAVKMFAAAIKSVGRMVRPLPIDCYNFEDKLMSGTTIINFMRNMEYPGLTGPVKFDVRGFRTDFGLDIFELMEGGQTIVGNWNSTKRPRLNVSRIISKGDDLNDDIRNRTFKVMITLTEPYGMRVESLDPLYGNDQYEGFAVDLIKLLSDMRGFNYTFILREDKANGKFDNATGKWTGIIGDLIEETADLAICDLTITMEREAVVDFTVPFMMLGISILYQKPKKAPPSFFSFADPFAFEVWELLMVAWIGVSLILFVVGRISPGEWENPYPCIEEPEFLVNQLDFRNCLWFVTGSIMQQGSEIELKSFSTRMIAGMWWFFTLLMVSSYTANLAAFLTTEKPDPHFTNFKELVENAERKNIKLGAKRGGATESFFEDKWKADPTSDFGKAWPLIQKTRDVIKIPDNVDGVYHARQGYYAFFMEDKSIEYETQRKCDLNQVGGKLDEKGYGIAMRKNSTYRNSLSTAILKLQNSGKIDEIKRKWWEERKGGGQCSSDGDNSDATPLNLKGVEGVFWVTILGTILAFFLALLEAIIQVARKAMRTETSFIEALKEEVKFYFKFGKMEKQVLYPESSSKSPSAEEENQCQYGFVVNPQMSLETLESNNSLKNKRSRSKRSRSRRSRSRRSRSKK
nr:glutamate receptor ionotropic, kainate 2-like [Leptinotarsa decemlineata]XP_023024798.1 glutamate receptor ionotropic, kainate 2-like [Leptinotarsa decemlineata]